MEILTAILVVATVLQQIVEAQSGARLLLVTVATEENDGFKLFLRSTKVNGIETKVLGLGEPWKGGDMTYSGGGYKVNLLRAELKKHKDDKDLIILFTDAYDVLVTGGKDEIVTKFESFEADIVFGAEDFCWPDETLKDEYPAVLHGYRFLCSGGFIGRAPQVYDLVSKPIEDSDDDQLYYTKQFLDPDTRHRLNIKLDIQAKLFQNLHGNIEDVALDFQDDDTRLINTVYQTSPVVIHGNGPSKTNLFSIGSYVAKSWVKSKGCLACAEGRVSLASKQESEYPLVMVAVFISRPTPFINEMLDKVAALNYPKKKLYIYVYNNVKSHETDVQKWFTERTKEGLFGSKFVSSSDKVKEMHARDLAVEKCVQISCDAYLNVDSEVHIDNPDTLRLLISYNRTILSPIMTQIGKLWSTFWGAVTNDGFYARSADYMDIVNGERTGIWIVPYVYGIYLIQGSLLSNPDTKPNYIHKLADQDIAMAFNYRKKNVFMYAVNIQRDYGHLLNADSVSEDHLHNDLWQVAANPFDWEQKYLHPEYYRAVDLSYVNEMVRFSTPCNDVYWFPLFTEVFCKQLIEIMEKADLWSGGKNEDPRLAGGYENVPTDDIHMNQVAFEQEWLYILKQYVKPFAEKVFIGYNSEAKAIMNFVVRYKPTAQNRLRPHHDSSTYTINVGLNRPGIDYEGGGARFIRQNCSVTATKVGWSLMHPGRLTHFHEGLPTTKGTRYIMVSFIDP